ncbi:MAG: hypothetical protein J5618_03280, partial [Bacilli bacterium]|nr:hypothetical protein [Bacilli bacterium]
MKHGGIVLPKQPSPERIIAMVLYLVAIIIDITRFAFELASGEFLLYEIAVLIFDTLFGMALLF